MGLPGSIIPRLSPIKGGEFFFEPFQLHLQPANLLVEFVHWRLLRRSLAPSILEKLARPFQETLLPRRNLRRMGAELLSQLRQRLVALESRQCHLRLEPRTTTSQLPCHDSLPPLSAF